MPRSLSTSATAAAFALAAATALAAGAAGAGCGACASRPATGIRVEVPREIVEQAGGAESLVLKIRLRAVDPTVTAGAPAVLNDLPEQVLVLCTGGTCVPPDAFEGAGSFDVELLPEDDSPFLDQEVVVHFALFANTAEEVRAAFEVIDDPDQMVQPCGPTPCSHAPLAALTALGARSIRLPRFGSSDADAVLFPLSFGGVDIDPDGDTIPGTAALSSAGGACVPYLEDPAMPWAAGPETACEAVTDPARLDCDDGAISVNPFELEPGDIAFGLCVDLIVQDCAVDGPCLDADGDGYPPPLDCNDADPLSYPGASDEACDGIDQDCLGGDVCPDCDLDDDGYCPMPVGVLPGGDCCDAPGDPGCMGAPPGSINPGALEYCGNGIDETCDGIDPPCGTPDADGDGFCSASYDCTDPMTGTDPCPGNTSAGRPICCIVRETIDAADLAACASFDDCADWDAGIRPSGPEVCGNGIDDDCDPFTLDACAPGDTDLDGFLAPLDCGEGDPSVNPDAGEVCGNGLDDDCEGGDAACGPAVDADGDGYVVCPMGASTGCDCDDGEPDVHPGAMERCNGVDDDCDGVVNDGNPDASAGGSPAPCYGNPIGGPGVAPYIEVLSEEWRCRIGVTACAADGSFTCILFVRPDPGTTCADDNQCNGRNDVCLPCGTPSGPDLPAGERDLDLDGCLACAGAEDRDGFLVTAGDACGAGTDCCDEGTEGGPGCSPGNAPIINTNQPELCTNQTIDNDCNGLGTEICGAGVTGDPCTTGLPGICSPGVTSCSATAACSPATGDSDGGMACGTFCNPSSCPYALAELCDTIGTDDDCDGVTTDVDDESSAGSFLWRAAPGCTPSAWSGACGCTAGGACSICTTDFYQCTGPAMPTCTPPAAPPAETCDGADTDCDCVSDYTDPDAQSACSGSMQYCDGSACMVGCDTAADCSNGNSCALNQCVCGPNPPCSGNLTCDTATGICECGGSVCDTIGETCNGAMDCACGSTSAGSGEACPDSSATAPDCVAGVGCRCQTSLCGPSETCTGVLGDCACGAAVAGTGEACPNTSVAPDCLSGVGCRCQTSLCGANETCTGPGGDCACGATTAGTGEACVDGSAAPDCVSGVGCRCQASLCGPSEACTGPGGDCACGGTTAPAGEACPAGPNPNCLGGACGCDANSTCDGDETCVAGSCTCGATAPAAGPACPPPQTCVSGACL